MIDWKNEMSENMMVDETKEKFITILSENFNFVHENLELLGERW
jgi:hypothetical protein